ncbi:MAG: ATP-binding protein [Lentisphaerae bacterium]|nr:ATP-binding protein [Lentisphaerota bacterium]
MKLSIKNFGPITSGFVEDKYMEIADFTMIIGPQGSGKSTIAKVLSTLMWIEKALVRGDFTEKELKLPGRFRARFDFHNIKSYFSDDSMMEYIGSMYHIVYHGESKLQVERVTNSERTSIPKIMYVPSERNFISVLPKPSLISELPESFASFLDEYDQARKDLNGDLKLPVNDVFFSYDRLNDISWVKRHNNKTRLSQAASGFQSLIPLFLVSAYLAEQYTSKKQSMGKGITSRLSANMGLSNEDLTRIRNEMQELLAKKPNDTRLVNMFNSLLASRIPSYFINIVEEPEQNLFPDTQIRMLFSLLSYRNLNEKNKLIVTTHSPYLLNAVSLAVASKNVYGKQNLSSNSRKVLESIVPKEAVIAPDQLRIYKTDEKGTISLLENIDGIPSDENYLNDILGSFNDDFGRILEMGDE